MSLLQTRTSRRERGAGFVVIALIALQALACATVARGTTATQRVVVTSTPGGAQVFIGSQPLGSTPVTLNLERRDSHIVLRLEKDGYLPQRLPVKQSLSGWLALDCFPLNRPVISNARKPRQKESVVATFAACRHLGNT